NNNDGIITASSDPSTTEIIEESNYYPFGLKHKGYNNVTSSIGNSAAQKFKYNGIEFEESLGLDLYEMDLRMYDPAIARWNAIDIVDHYEFSPYQAFDNNPAFFADPSGADAESFFNKLFKDSKSGDKWVNNNGTFTNQRTGQSETCDDCEEGASRPEMVGVPRGGVAPHKTRKQYYHTGAAGKSGWHSEESYNDILDKVALTIINGNVSEGTMTWINSLDDQVYEKLMKRVGIVEQRIAAYNHFMMSGYTGEMHFSSPIFIGLSFVRTPSFSSNKFNSTVDDIMANPNLLKGNSYIDVRKALNGSDGWINSVMKRTRGTDKGWVFRQVNSKGQPTGKVIQYHPGSRRHFGGNPYWKVSNGTTTTRIPVK
ncbi:RHS repeat-associated core domain-containing protein, partial [Tenacibaculum sp. FZY0031]|uniref:RHS repeat domain-containing protein n=1 Tax=Tenacibaculum sp. FZY0031 TaxID=3116648 RepID=UPI002EC0A1FA|nr:RHS repeat-associated core domain-containing protein [Tenacibaculum sp. FZY0031]